MYKNTWLSAFGLRHLRNTNYNRKQLEEYQVEDDAVQEQTWLPFEVIDAWVSNVSGRYTFSIHRKSSCAETSIRTSSAYPLRSYKTQISIP